RRRRSGQDSPSRRPMAVQLTNDTGQNSSKKHPWFQVRKRLKSEKGDDHRQKKQPQPPIDPSQKCVLDTDSSFVKHAQEMAQYSGREDQEPGRLLAGHSRGN